MADSWPEPSFPSSPCLPLTELPLGLAHGPRTPGPLEEMGALQQPRCPGPSNLSFPRLSDPFGLFPLQTKE